MATKSALQAFLDQAYYWAVTNPAKESGGQNKFAKGSELAKIFSLAGASAGTAWCAIFVYACARKAGITSGKHQLLSNQAYAPKICKSVIAHGGQWIKGPYTTKSKVKPQPGDLILYNNSGCHMKYNSEGHVSAWHGYHVGIVYKVTSTQVITMEGNVKGGRAKKVKHSLSASCIGGYARPKWSKAGVVNVGDDGGDPGPLYQSKNDRHDMTMREIGYMDSNGKLSKSSSAIHASIINYTTLLGDLYDEFVRNTYGDPIVDTSKLSGNEKIVVEYLRSSGFNSAAACGIAGNIKVDSNYNAATQSGTAYGICKWTGTSAGLMRDSAGMTHWATNLSGQLDFLVGDLIENYSSLLKTLKGVAVSSSGVKKAAEEFAKTYRKISSTADRVSKAQAIYSNIVVTPAKSAGTVKKVPAKKQTCTVIDVSKKPQKELAQCYRNFEVGTADTTMLKEWEQKGKSTSKGLAYMNNCYLVAYNTSLSLKVGNYIELVTGTGGVIPCFVAGGFNDSKTPIKFYREPKSNINLLDWRTLTISKIKNFGERA